jgi:hypothetical protein
MAHSKSISSVLFGGELVAHEESASLTLSEKVKRANDSRKNGGNLSDF